MRHCNRVLYILIAVLIITNGFAGSANGHRGLFPIRNQFPLRLPFLSFIAKDAIQRTDQQLSFSVSLSQSNTFAMTTGVISLLGHSDQRTSLSLDQKNQQHFINDNLYLLDVAVTNLMIGLKYRLNDDITIGISMSILSYNGGFLDPAIELFHNNFGIDNDSRAKMVQNNSQIFITNNSTLNNLSPKNFPTVGLNDPSFLLHYSLMNNGKWAVVSRAALKIPIGSVESLRSNGGYDFGFELISTRIFNCGYLTNSISTIIPGKWHLAPDLDIRPFYSWLVAYELKLNSQWSLIAQNQIQSSMFTSDLHPLLAEPVYELTLGAKADLSSNSRLSLSITQNYINHQNTADFGIQLGFEGSF